MSTISLMLLSSVYSLHLMEARDLKQSDLVGILGSRALPRSHQRKRGISKAQAKALGEFFHVSPALFLIEGTATKLRCKTCDKPETTRPHPDPLLLGKISQRRPITFTQTASPTEQFFPLNGDRHFKNRPVLPPPRDTITAQVRADGTETKQKGADPSAPWTQE